MFFSFFRERKTNLTSNYFGVDTRRLAYSSFNTQLISINYLVYRNNHLSMPRQTINQTRREKSEEQKSRVLLKDDSFINEHLIPKKANDDRRHLAWNFRSKRKLDYETESWKDFRLLKGLFLKEMVETPARKWLCMIAHLLISDVMILR